MQPPKIANISLASCLAAVKDLANQEVVYLDQIPEVLVEDFTTYNAHQAQTNSGDRVVVYNIRDYYNKLMYKGIDYRVQWLND